MALLHSSTRRVLYLIRWKTLSAALAPGLVALGLAVGRGGELALVPFLCCAPSAFLIQIGTNLINDAMDFHRGVDNPKRIGPKRVTSPGAKFGCFVIGMSCFPISLLFSLPAILLRGELLLKLEVLCCLMGCLYTGGPIPFGYYALGDLVVFLFFGIGATCLATFVLQGGAVFGGMAVVAGCQIGCTAVNLLVVNNLRDIVSDQAAEKFTLSNLLGYSVGRWELVLNAAVAYGLGLWWLWKGYFVACVLPFLSLPLCVRSISNVFSTKPTVTYNRFLQDFSFLHLFFALLLATGLALSSNWV